MDVSLHGGRETLDAHLMTLLKSHSTCIAREVFLSPSNRAIALAWVESVIPKAPKKRGVSRSSWPGYLYSRRVRGCQKMHRLY
ncbi:hypothetical protein AMTR_s00023p00066460 [Amborella trichopoda]|uniref:Uncharacterized protein n=1 Tax=Amborella trichopoda TaxID=13333 RepID=W1NK43_AMBTC|nr:hypothetical protein AMTR_s00023p00066460 [Amborella trichopoda]